VPGLEKLTPALNDQRRHYAGLLSSRWPKSMRDWIHDAKSCRRILERLRVFYRLSQAELAGALNCSVDTVQAWEAGRRNPSGAARTAIHLLEMLLVMLPAEAWEKATKMVWGGQLPGIFVMSLLLRGRKEARERAEDSNAELLEEFESQGPEEQAAAIEELEKLLTALKRQRLERLPSPTLAPAVEGVENRA
jgi:transcriptional regulator with XRE-family HTH domain